MLILTVEDEFLISEYLRAILEGGGHTVIAKFDADEAIKVLERVRDIQLVITDIDMPGSMDGLRLAAAIRDRWPPIHLNPGDRIGSADTQRVARRQPTPAQALQSGRHFVSRGWFSGKGYFPQRRRHDVAGARLSRE
jgi:CheY-like chemotaxis protein